MFQLEDETVDKLKRLAENEDPDIKSIGLMSLHMANGYKLDIRNYLTEQLKQLGDQENSIRARWALALDYLGSVYVQKNQFDKSIQLYKKSLEVVPDDPFVLVNLGNAYGSSGLLDRAITCFKMAIEIKPDYEIALINLGTAYQRKGLLDESYEALQKAVDIKPNVR